MYKEQLLREALNLSPNAIEYYVSQILATRFPTKVLVEGGDGLFNVEEYAMAQLCEVEHNTLLDGAAICTVNLAEVVAKLNDAGAEDQTIYQTLGLLGLNVVDFDRELAYRSGLLRSITRGAGLSLGDRACLALAMRLSLPVFTADRVWSGLSLGIAIRLVR